MTNDELRNIGMRVGDLCSFDDARQLYDYVAELRAENARLRNEMDVIRRTHTGGYILSAALVKP